MNLLIIMGSVREGRYADTVLQKIKDVLPAGINLHAFDPKLTPLPFVDSSVTPSMSEKFDNDIVTVLNELVDRSDAVILLSPEYNHSVSGVLKNAIDWVSKPWKDKPVILVNYSYQMTGLPIKHLIDIMQELKAKVYTAPVIPIAGDYDYGQIAKLIQATQPDTLNVDDAKGGKTQEEQ